jgi:phytoene dehydrogenase-like protein
MEAYRFSMQSVRSWADQTVGIVDKMKLYEWGDSVFVMLVALESPINYKAGSAARQSAHVHLTEPSLDFFARVYLQCRGGFLPAAPMIVGWNDSTVDPSRAPGRQSVDEIPGAKCALLHHWRRYS